MSSPFQSEPTRTAPRVVVLERDQHLLVDDWHHQHPRSLPAEARRSRAHRLLVVGAELRVGDAHAAELVGSWFWVTLAARDRVPQLFAAGVARPRGGCGDCGPRRRSASCSPSRRGRRVWSDEQVYLPLKRLPEPSISSSAPALMARSRGRRPPPRRVRSRAARRCCARARLRRGDRPRGNVGDGERAPGECVGDRPPLDPDPRSGSPDGRLASITLFSAGPSRDDDVLDLLNAGHARAERDQLRRPTSS